MHLFLSDEGLPEQNAVDIPGNPQERPACRGVGGRAEVQVRGAWRGTPSGFGLGSPGLPGAPRGDAPSVPLSGFAVNFTWPLVLTCIVLGGAGGREDKFPPELGDGLK